MLLNELFEAGTKHVTFCFGRMNPPTVGHKQVFDTMSSQGGDMKIFVSQSQDKKKNPLDYGTKIKFIKAMFPEYAKNVIDNAALNTIGKVASYLHEQGYNAATFVAGSDRLEDMKSLLTQYNGVEGKAHGFYKFDVIDFASSGDREDGAEGVAGVSASGARSAAANNDFEGFREATGAGELAKPLFAAVRKGMGIKGEVEESSLNEFDPGEDGFGPFKVYVHDEFIEKFATFDQAKEEIEFLRTADPKSFDADWKIIDGIGKTVWQHDPGEAIDAMRMRRKLQFIKPDEGVAEGSQEINWVKPNFDFEWHEVEEQSRMKQVPVDVRQYYQKHFPNKDAWLKAVQNGKAVVVPPDHAYEIRNAPFDKASLQKVLAPTGHEGPIGPAKEKRVNDLFDKGQVEMPIILKTSQGLWLIGGKTRLGTANYVKGLPAKVWLISGKQGVGEDISRRGFLRGVGAAAAGVGAANTAQAQISGEDFLPDIVAHVRFKVNGKEINKEINLGTTYKSPKEAGAALEKFLKSKGIKYYEYELERVKPKEKGNYESQ